MARQKMLFRNNYVSLTKSRYTHTHKQARQQSVTQPANKNERAHKHTHTRTQSSELSEKRIYTHIHTNPK